ncbi:two-pore potassium channel 1-like [Neltuma alba]|uniref:two-pore potassium channel 1-like n=1 Tax=Neltuma alba TaxID=207710 RepID=UPI0010A5808F|nr:two-pore potassium channel 1-like [Prosopis alba]
MGDHEVQQKPEKEPLLSYSKNHTSNPNKKMNDLQRRRRPPHGDVSSENGINKEEENLIQQTLQLSNLDSEFKSKKLVLLLILTAYLGLGTLSFFLIRNQIMGIQTNGFLDALYFCVVTMTTVGYGDLVPNSKLAKLLASVYVFTGMALVGMIMSKAADYFLEKQEILLVRAIHMGEKVSPSELLEEVEAQKVKYKFLITLAVLLVLMMVGTVFLHLVENLELLDAFYCVCSTVTTLGYGDKSFSTSTGRGFAVFWILSSTICLAQFFYYLAELYTEGRQKSLVRTVLSRKLLRSDLEAADLDHDNVVSAAEFIVYKLKEMGRISQQDISIVDAFRKLDYDKSGTLTEADLGYSGSS